MSAPEITTYTNDMSICSQIARLALCEHGLAFKDVFINHNQMQQFEPWYVRINPNMTVPSLTYNGELMIDSKAILFEIAKRHPEAGLLPAEYKADSVEADLKRINSFINMFYDAFGALSGFTFGHIMTWGWTYKSFVVNRKMAGSVAKVWELKEDPEFAEVASKKLAKLAMSGPSVRHTPLINHTVKLQEMVDWMEY
jgi:glutathione S-transferase